MKGNEAIGEAAVLAGCRYYFAYPITPQNEIPAYLSKRMPEDWVGYLKPVIYIKFFQERWLQVNTITTTVIYLLLPEDCGTKQT